ncbi:MAG: DUF2283 domain-containing protein [Phycisphaerae bacterium]|nr:DUF2283 domain-containing protein [Phycisphaerae bacterium]
MKVRYFPETDTARIALSDRAVAETREMSEDVLADLNADGALVALTIEHASNKTDVNEFSFQQVAKQPA